MKNNIILHFVATTPKIYSAFDKYNLELSKQLSELGWKSIFIFIDSIENNQIKEDLLRSKASVEILPSNVNKIQLFFRIVKLYRIYKPKIVHVHFTIYLRIINALICFFARIKLYNTIHSLITFVDAKEFKLRKGKLKFILLRLYLRGLLACSNNIICVSEAIRKQYIEISKSNSLKVITNYLGVKNLTIAKKKLDTNQQLILSNPEQKIRIANIGAFEYLKGIETLIYAIHYLKNQLNTDNFKVYHIGGNRIDNTESIAYNEQIFQLVNDLDITTHIEFLGKRNDIEELLPLFDIYVHPSYMEGIGAVNMEACSASLPIIASNIGGIPEIVVNNKNGFLVESQNKIPLAQRMKILINDSTLRRKMGLMSYEKYQQKFNIKKQVAKYIQIIGI